MHRGQARHAWRWASGTRGTQLISDFNRPCGLEGGQPICWAHNVICIIMFVTLC